MSTDQRNLLAFLGSDTDFRAWGTGIAAQLVAAGLTKTADTGQIDWTTVARPAAGNTIAGFEVYRFTDALQATAPIFLKVEYGVNAQVDRPAIALTVGTGSNGSGALSGQVGTRRGPFGPATSKTAATLLPSYGSGSMASSAFGGRVMLMTHHDPASTNFTYGFLVERTRGGDGIPTADGIIVFACGYVATTGTDAFGVIPFTGTVPPDQTVTSSVNGAFPSIATAERGQVGSQGANIVLCPGLAFVNGKVFYTATLTYRVGEIPLGASFSAAHLGATHTFWPFASVNGNAKVGITSGANSGLALPWE